MVVKHSGVSDHSGSDMHEIMFTYIELTMYAM
jgi:hypothetical protein